MLFAPTRANYADILRHQSLFRVVAYALFASVVLVRLAFGLFTYPALPVFAITLVALALAGAGYGASYATHTPRSLRGFLLAAPVLDLIIVGGINYASGLIQSYHLLLFLVPAFSAMFISVRFACSIGASVLIVFFTGVLGHELGWWTLVEKGAYTSSELIMIQALRLALFVAIAIVGVLLVLISHLRIARRALEARETVVFALVQELSGAIDGTRAILAAHKGRAHDVHALLNDAEREATLREERFMGALATLTDDALPIARQIRVLQALSCSRCRSAISIGGSYYAIPASYRAAYNFGTARNDIHCERCHALASEERPCAICAAWLSPAAT